eukprot:2492031-Rhodomonas_salina.2
MRARTDWAYDDRFAEWPVEALREVALKFTEEVAYQPTLCLVQATRCLVLQCYAYAVPCTGYAVPCTGYAVPTLCLELQ